MRPVEFTPEQIIQAGQDLQAAGRNITGFALRQKVGGGNPARLKQVWDEHAAGQAVATIEPVAELPVEVADEVASVAKALTDRLAAVAVELNDRAVRAAERRVHEIVRTAGEQREQAERELADAGQTVEDLEGKLDAADAAALSVRGQLAEALEVGQAQAVELAQLRERLSLIEQNARAAGEQHAAALAGVNAQLAAATADLDQARAAAQEAQGEARELTRRTQEQGAALEATRIKLGEAERAAATLGVERDRAQLDAADAARHAEQLAEERHIEIVRLTERAEVALAGKIGAEEAAQGLRLQVATLTERAAHVADLRAIIDRLQTQPQTPDTPAPRQEPTALPLDVAPVPAKKATTTKRRTPPPPAA